MRGYLRKGPRQTRSWRPSDGQRRERRRQDDRATDRIAAALALIRQSDERWHGLAVWLSRSGMAHDADLLDRLAARAEASVPGKAGGRPDAG